MVRQRAVPKGRRRSDTVLRSLDAHRIAHFSSASLRVPDTDAVRPGREGLSRPKKRRVGAGLSVRVYMSLFRDEEEEGAPVPVSISVSYLSERGSVRLYSSWLCRVEGGTRCRGLI